MKQHANMQKLMLIIAAIGFATVLLLAIPPLALLVEYIAGRTMSEVPEIIGWLDTHSGLAAWVSAFAAFVVPAITFWAGGTEARLIKKMAEGRKNAFRHAFVYDVNMSIHYLDWIYKQLSDASISIEGRVSDAPLKATEGLSYLEGSVTRGLEYPEYALMADCFIRGFQHLIDYAPSCTNESGITILKTLVSGLSVAMQEFVNENHSPNRLSQPNITH